MAIAKLLGFDLCPRLKALKDRHLFLPHGSGYPEVLRSICHANIDLVKIVAQWEQIVHLVALDAQHARVQELGTYADESTPPQTT
jgi:TnpA family transposase